MILAQVLGQGPRDLSASAIAVMDFVSQIGAGCLPIAVNKDYAYKHQGLYINFTPDPSDNAGWFTDPPDTANARTIRDYIDNAACDPLHIGDIINLQNGNDASCLQDLKNKLAAVMAAGGNWVVCLPVVNTDKFNQDTPIANFVSFKITEVTATGSDKGVTGDVLGLCEFQNALPGGGNVAAPWRPPSWCNKARGETGATRPSEPGNFRRSQGEGQFYRSCPLIVGGASPPERLAWLPRSARKPPP